MAKQELKTGKRKFLIYSNKDIIGTIFGGVSIITATSMFISMFINKQDIKKRY